MSVDNFAMLALVGTILPITMSRPMEIFRTQPRVGPHFTLIWSDTEH